MRERHEFSQKVKRQALDRAQGCCEASGPVYGLPAGVRCNGDLSRGKQIDHYPAPAGDPGSDVLENAVVCCLTCHGFKTRYYDIPVLAKGKRVADKHQGIQRRSGRGFRKAEPQHTATTKPTKRVGFFEEETQ